MANNGGLVDVARMHASAWSRAALEMRRIATKPGGPSDSIDDRILAILATAAIIVSHAYFSEAGDGGASHS